MDSFRDIYEELEFLKQENERLKEISKYSLEVYKYQKEEVDKIKAAMPPKTSLFEVLKRLAEKEKEFYQSKINFLTPDFTNLYLQN